MSPNNANVSMMTVFPTSPDATGAGGGGGLSTNGLPMLPLANLTSNNGRQSPINTTAAVRNGDSLSVTPVLSPATSFQDGVKGFLASGAGGRDYEHTLTVNGQLASNNTIATPTVGSYPSFQIPSNVPLERVVFKALSMGDYMAWLSVFDQYLDLAVLNKCGMVIPNVVVEPSDEFGHLYKTFAAYGERLPDPNPALIQEDMGLNF